MISTVQYNINKLSSINCVAAMMKYMYVMLCFMHCLARMASMEEQIKKLEAEKACILLYKNVSLENLVLHQTICVTVYS